MLNRFIVLISFFTTIFLTSTAQQLHVMPKAPIEDTKPKPNRIWNFDLVASVDFPQADMAKRFGVSDRIGLSIKLKTSTNWLIGVKAELITGKKITQDSLLYNVKTSQNAVISQAGDLLNVGTFERGYLCGIQVGKIFPVLQLNPNSGPMMMVSTGFMQHKIKLFDKDNALPQIRDEYKKGYDRLTNGIYVEDFIGYNYYAKNRLVNFYAGFDFVWGFTQGRRDYLLDVARTDNAKRNDILIGFKLGWVVPIYKKITEETYY